MSDRVLLTDERLDQLSKNLGEVYEAVKAVQQAVGPDGLVYAVQRVQSMVADQWQRFQYAEAEAAMLRMQAENWKALCTAQQETIESLGRRIAELRR